MLVEATGLEPAASWSQTKHSTKLSYASDSMPDSLIIIAESVKHVKSYRNICIFRQTGRLFQDPIC